ncbi:MAG: DUF4272 domain-containing protein [Acidimicrobiales bacterium]
MLQGPLQVFGRQGDPEHIALLIARSLAGAQVERHAGRYRVTVGTKKGLFRQEPPSLVVEIDAAGFDGDGLEARHAVRDELIRSMRGPGLEDVLAMIPEVRIGISFRPVDVERVRRTGPLAHLAIDIAARTDGFVLDLHNGRLVSTTGELLGSAELLRADGGTPVDPSLTRVRARLVALVAVAARCLTEYDGRDLDEARHGIARWVRSAGLGAELEPHEEALLQRPSGQIDHAELAYGSWQVEGAAVLAWALELLDDLPAYDAAVDPTLVTGLLCFPDAAKTQAVLALGKRRFHATVEAEAARHRAIYQQLSEFAARDPAGADEVDMALSITTERLRACQWLMSGGLYSATGLG